jgi:hypothetical protein
MEPRRFARDELALAERLVEDDGAFEADRAEGPGVGSERLLDLVHLGGAHVDPEDRRELRLVEPVVAAYEREHDLAVRDDRHRLRRRREVDAQEAGEILARRDPGGLDRGGCVQACREGGRARHAARDLEVGGVVAPLARDERVLPGSGRREVVDRLLAAHHPRLRLDGDDLEPAPRERALVCAGVRAEAPSSPPRRGRTRGVLHDELADADEAGAGSWLVAHLRLEVVEDLWELPV